MVEGGDKYKQSNKTVYTVLFCFVLKGEFYEHCLIGSCCQRFSVGRVFWVVGKAPEWIPVLGIDAFIGFYSFFSANSFPVSGITTIVGNFCVFSASHESQYVLWNFAEQGLKIQMFLKLTLFCYNLLHLDFVLFWQVLEIYVQSLCWKIGVFYFLSKVECNLVVSGYYCSSRETDILVILNKILEYNLVLLNLFNVYSCI